MLRLRATRAGLAPSLGAWEGTVVWTTALSAFVILGAVVLMMRVWAPLQGLRSRASTDALTGLANRHEFHRLGGRMVASAAAEGRAVCLVVLDLDAFKAINDSLGHDGGDAALAAAARTLLDGTRARDLVARIGGDEFVVVQRVDDESDAEIRAHVELLRSKIAGRLSDVAGEVEGVGATAGFAVERSGAPSLDRLLRRADAALVRGKSDAKGTTYEAPPEDA